MIKKVNIKKFGLFSNFQWNFTRTSKKGDTKNVLFEKENIIYGRNYSGKTTLSRIIRSLETKTISVIIFHSFPKVCEIKSLNFGIN